jgi:glycosyltransferase involved in cell wall biosynthesis
VSQGLHILIHNCRLLHPLHGGDRIRTYHMLRELRKRHHLTYLCLRTPADQEDAASRALEYCHELIAIAHPVTNQRSLRFYAGVVWNTCFGKYPFLSQKYLSREALRQLAKITSPAEKPAFDLIVCDYLAPMVNLLELPRRPELPILLFQHNVESVIFGRHAQTAKHRIKARLYHRQWQMMRRFENQSAAYVDAQIAVSEADVSVFRAFGMTNVFGAVPTGVDCEYFQPSEKLPVKPVLAFLGAMDWDANEDAVKWFIAEILPRVRAQIPGVEFRVIGRNPSGALQELVARDESIHLTGTLPDIRPAVAEARAMVLPLRIGGGTRIKIYEAMAMGVPVISTTIGAEGLDVTHGRNILLADTPDAFASETVALLKDTNHAAAIAQEARQHVATNYSWARVAEIFSDFCHQAIARRQAAAGGGSS